MIKNIVIGKNSSVSKALIKFIKNYEIISANELNYDVIKKIQSKKK